jgi:putative oxidoreductase
MSTLTLSVRPDLGLLLLRAALAGMWLSHGLLLKLLTYGAAGLSAWPGH